MFGFGRGVFHFSLWIFLGAICLIPMFVWFACLLFFVSWFWVVLSFLFFLFADPQLLGGFLLVESFSYSSIYGLCQFLLC